MTILTLVLVSLVALGHTYFLMLEMFLWTTPKGIKTFGLKSKEFAEDTKVLAANQGLYNGFLAAGLVYSLIIDAHSFIGFFRSPLNNYPAQTYELFSPRLSFFQSTRYINGQYDQ